ncbi:MAG: phosphate signaling complex protein PhoU [Candidatus Sumerlaeaceae bacterium]|nr:phosphate signaling complex protein PhoU [Candidatus Sumerlaeaceae bacterium]
MGRYFDENYDLLKQKLGRMAADVNDVIGKTFEALTRGDITSAGEVIKTDDTIDHSEVEIDELVLKLMALQQPMAIDLRFLVTALKINNDLERMGDQAVNIAHGIIILNQKKQSEYLIDFTRMESVVQEMVRDCIEAFTTGNVELARRVCDRDDEVDEMNRSFIRRLVDHVRTHPEDADRCISLVLITRNLERIGDLCTNIAEDVVYYIEGRIIKHHNADQPHPVPGA